IQKLLAALVVAGRSSQQEIGKIDTRLTSVKREIAIRRAGIALVDLQITELAAKLHGVLSNHLREAIGDLVSIVGLARCEGGHADREVVEVNRRYRLREAGRAAGIDAERARAGDKPQIRQLGEAAFGFVGMSG